MLKRLLKVLLLVTIACFSTSPWAEDYWYSVEYIVFENLTTADYNQEPWLGNITAIPDTAIRPQFQSGTNADWISMRALRPDELSLGGVRRALRQSTAYQVLEHEGWLQQESDEDLVQPVHVMISGQNNAVDGTIAFRRERFLHLDVDLTLSDGAASAVPGTYDAAPISRFRLQQTRRIQSNKLNYFDHPKFGVLVKVMPLEKPEPVEPPPTPETIEPVQEPSPENPPATTTN